MASQSTSDPGGISLVMALTPASFFGVTMLIQERAFWLLFPKAAIPFQLGAPEVFQGDAQNGDLVRMNLVANYAPQSVSREMMDGEKCWRLDLAWKHVTVSYPRIVGWITERQERPFTPSMTRTFSENGEVS